MKARLTLKEILGIAVSREIEAQHLYTDLSQKIDTEAAKDAFLLLAQQECGHQNLLEQYMRGELEDGVLGQVQVLDYRIVEHFGQPIISTDMKLKDVFLLAANREQISHEFYLGFASIHPDGPIKRVLEEIASQELMHKQQVEFLYTEVAFPQTDGG
jgi:rubrerythrin